MPTNVYMTTSVDADVTLSVVALGPDSTWEGYLHLASSVPRDARSRYIGYISRDPGVGDHTTMFEVAMHVGRTYVCSVGVLLGVDDSPMAIKNVVYCNGRFPNEEFARFNDDYDGHRVVGNVGDVVYTLAWTWTRATGFADLYLEFVGHFLAADWMTAMNDHIGDVPLRRVLLPGTHDSGTGTMTAESRIAPLGTWTAWMRLLANRLPRREWITSWFLAWGRTQVLDVQTQLAAGIRYLDLRVWRDPNDGRYYLVHGLVGESLTDALPKIASFLDAHPGEALLLDFQQLFFDGETDHEAFVDHLKTLLGTRLAPRSMGLNVTLNQLVRSTPRRQAIAAYNHDDAFVVRFPELWFRAVEATSAIRSPRTLAGTPDEVRERLASLLPNRQAKFFVLQAILDVEIALGNVNVWPWRTLQNFADIMNGWLVDNFVSQWMRNTSNNVNVVMLDFFDNCDLVKSVIEANLAVYPGTDAREAPLPSP